MQIPSSLLVSSVLTGKLFLVPFYTRDEDGEVVSYFKKNTNCRLPSCVAFSGYTHIKSETIVSLNVRTS